MFTWVDVCSTQPLCRGIQSAYRRVTHQRPRRRRRVYFGPFRNNPENNGVDQIVTRPPVVSHTQHPVGQRSRRSVALHVCFLGTRHCSDRQYSDRHCSVRHCSVKHCSDKRYPWALYTVSQKTRHQSLAHNFTKYLLIFTILSQLDSVVNL